MMTPLRTELLSERALYLFDTTGLLKIPRFLGWEDVQRFCDAIFSCPSRVMAGRGGCAYSDHRRLVNFDELRDRLSRFHHRVDAM